ncbi:ribosomal-protein-alanine N-acetyltransferase [Candidatus Bathyarchaeota archaeon]|nr:MAG: ribosomal-protein-alanine N-acetyltransferase [Candidatus Bathyarchaeota archaeon]
MYTKQEESITVRHVRLEEDLPKLESIEKFSFTHPYSRSLLKTLATLDIGEFLVAVVNGEVVGYISSILETKGLASIASIAVHPSYRRKKIAKRLLAELIQILRRRGVFEVRLEVRKSNLPAQNLYKSFGFKCVCTLQKYYEDGEDAIVMYLSLKNNKHGSSTI